MRSCGEQAAGQLTLQKTGWVAGSLLTLRMHVSHAHFPPVHFNQQTTRYNISILLDDTGSSPAQPQAQAGGHWELTSTTIERRVE